MFDWIADAIVAVFQPMLRALVQSAYSIFNYCVTFATGLFGITPQGLKGGAPWAIIQRLNPIFIAVASSIVTTIFLAGFIQEMVNIRQELSFYAVIRLFLRLVFANGLIVFAIDICKQIFTLFANWAILVGNTRTSSLSVPSALMHAVNNVDWGASIIGTLVALICVIVAAVLGGMLIYTVYMRLFKLLILVPLAPVAFSTAAGGGGMVSAGAFFKNLLALSGEIVVIAIALALSNAVVGTGLGIDFGSTSSIVTILVQLLGGLLSMAMVSGTVMGAEKIIREAFRF